MSEIIIQIEGLELRGFHGALAEEKQKGQRFLFDVEVVAHDAGVRSDNLQDTVDYTEVVECVRTISEGRNFNLIEALAASVADSLLERFPISRARVRVRKPEVRLDASVEFTAAIADRTGRPRRV
ncbi:MAG TPA: dihydroneopterin aldolase [Gaiellaceae bacterium]|nr:dihydroneopterin aldolase [Gaiellaceae bacterium]